MATTTLSKKKQTQNNRETRRAEQATATLKRAWEIAARGMFKEAVLLWEHALRLGSDTSPPPEILLTWMINAHQFNKAIHFFTANEAAIQYNQPKLWNTARELFAVAILTADPEMRPLPPWTSPPWNQGETAGNALGAFCRKERHAMQAYLTPIEPNSPYRPFRRILESLLLPESETETIAALLHHIPECSPFAPLSTLARARILAPEALATTLLSLPPVARTPIALLCGIGEKPLKLLVRMGQAHNPGEQVALLLGHADLLPTAPTRNACLNLLPDCMEERSRFEKRFGPLEEFARERLFALHHERQNSFSRAVTYWRKCLLLLENGPDTVENNLKIALLYTRLATIEQRYASPSTTQIIDYLEKSLTHDPANPKTWLELLHWRNRLKRDRQTFYRQADKAARLFPQDAEILSIAMAAAMEKGAFKKAAGVARNLLKQNRLAAGIIEARLTALMRHTRKLIQAGHYELARKELARAATLQPEGNPQVSLLGAMVALLDEQPREAERLLEQGRALATKQVEYAVLAFLEAASLDLPPLTLDRFRHALIQCDATAPHREEVIAIAGLIGQLHARHPALCMEVMALLSGYFRKAAVLVYNLDEMRRVCQTLALTQRHLLLGLFGKLAETRWPQEPIFTYFRACGQCEGLAWRLTDQDFYTLLQAAEELKERDPQGVAMINTLLAIPTSQRPSGPWHSIPLSPAKIPKPLETKLLRELRSRLQEEFQANQDEAATQSFRKRLLDSLLQTEFGQRGPLVLGYLIDRALKIKKGAEKHDAPHPTPHQQLEMDLFPE